MAEPLRMTQAELIAMREWVQSVNKECDERLSREMTLVYRLDKQRTRVLAVKYMSKGEAAEWAKTVPPGELLGLDSGHGGMLLCDSYVFVSERTLAEGLRDAARAAVCGSEGRLRGYHRAVGRAPWPAAGPSQG
jgi:hypothetical protein